MLRSCENIRSNGHHATHERHDLSDETFQLALFAHLSGLLKGPK